VQKAGLHHKVDEGQACLAKVEMWVLKFIMKSPMLFLENDAG
jgi:hypothetical protein